MARGTDCQAHTHNAKTAQERHHLRPQSRGGRGNAANMRMLCANAHGDTHYLLDAIEDAAVPLIGTGAAAVDAFRAVPWRERNSYGNGIRDAAVAGWLMYADEFLAGEFLAHHRLWRTSGQSRELSETLAPRITRAVVPPYAVALSMGEVDELLDLARPA